MSDTQAKIREMAKLAIFSNRITEIHERNLKTYPFIFFNGVTSTRIDYDFASNATEKAPVNTNRGYVHYYLTIEDTADNRVLKRFEAISQSVRNLFWSDTQVKVFFNDQLVYETKNG